MKSVRLINLNSKAINIFVIAAIIWMPGIYIYGNLISPIDAIVPMLFISNIIKRTGNKSLIVRIKKQYVALVMYIAAALLSILLNGGSIVSFFKWFRLAYALVILDYIQIHKKEFANSAEYYFRVIMVNIVITGVIGILMFLNQNQYYASPETLYFNGHVLNRAGGVFAEAGTFSLMMAFGFCIAIAYLYYYGRSKLSLITAIVMLIGILVSDTRIAFIAVFVDALYILLKDKKCFARNIFIAFFCLIFLVFLIYKLPFLNRFFIERILPVFNSNNNLNAVSSNRLNLWSNRLKSFFHDSYDKIIFGSGYKNGMNSLSDNNYISALYNVGIVGWIFFMIFWVQLLIQSLRKKSCNYIFSQLIIITMIIFMFTCDAMTMMRPLYIFILVLNLSEWAFDKEKIS